MARESDRDRQHAPISTSSNPPAPPAGAVTATVNPEQNETKLLRDQLVEKFTQAGYDEAAVFALRLSFEEAINNAVKYGSQSPGSQVTVDYHVTPDEVYLRITDDGSGFDPAAIPDPTSDEHIATPTGRGLFLIRAYMSEVVFNEKGNSIVLIYRNRSSE